MNQPLNVTDLAILPNEPEKLFAKLFFEYGLNEFLYLYHELRPIVNPDTLEKSLPDFEIIPKSPDNYNYSGGVIELTTKHLDTPKKGRQRRAVLGWIRLNPGYFALEITLEVLKEHPDFVLAILDIFQGKTNPISIQGKISAIINRQMIK